MVMEDMVYQVVSCFMGCGERAKALTAWLVSMTVLPLEVDH